MYRFSVDEIHKIILIEISGFLQQGEILQFGNDKKELFNQYEPHTYSLLIDAHRLDPICQDCIPLYQEVMAIGFDWAKRIAVVSGNRTVTRMQMSRIEASIRHVKEENIPIMRFDSMQEARLYIME